MEDVVSGTFFNIANVIFRVPPLFIIDELLRIGLGLPGENVVLDSEERGFKIAKVPDTAVNSVASLVSNSLIEPFDFGHLTYKMYLMIVMKFLCCCLGKIFTLQSMYVTFVKIVVIFALLIYLSMRIVTET